jgi:hypothetical protein
MFWIVKGDSRYWEKVLTKYPNYDIVLAMKGKLHEHFDLVKGVV